MALLDQPIKINGSFGDFYEFVLDDAVTGDGTTVLAAGFYVLKTRDIATTTLPKKTGTTGVDIEAGDMFYSDGTLVAAATDEYYPIIIISKSDITSWSLDGSCDVGEATTFADIRTSPIKRKLTGLVDLTGSMTGVNTILVSDAEDWSLNSFLPITQIDGKASATRFDANNDTKYGLFVTNKTLQGGTVPIAFLAAPFRFTSTAVSGDPTQADGTPIGGDFVIVQDSKLNIGYIVAHNTEALEQIRKAQ